MKILTSMGLLLVTMLLTGLPSFGAQVSIGVRIGPPPPPRVVYVLPANPGPEYVWVDGYWYPMETIGGGIKAIGLGHRMPALVGWLLVMSAGNTLKVTGKEITGGYRMTTTGTVTGTGIFARKSTVRVGVGATITNSGGSTTDVECRHAAETDDRALNEILLQWRNRPRR